MPKNRKSTTKPLPTILEKYFNAWISVDTWHTNHLSDAERFYAFVWAVRRFGWHSNGKTKKTKCVPTEREVFDAIVEAERDSVDAGYLEQCASKWSSLYVKLLDFAAVPNIADPLIEKTDIVAFHFALERNLGGHGNATPSSIAIRMRQVWGDDWKQKLDKEKNT